jgi:hypothetical protein
LLPKALASSFKIATFLHYFNPKNKKNDSFVDSEEEIDVIDDSEPLERYEEGPCYCGHREVLAGRHRIEHKLG